MKRMYAEAKVWSVFAGCRFNCSYCRPSFQAQAKRQKHNCEKCYRFEPHEHPERLTKIPNSPIVFVAGSGDISFASPEYFRQILDAIRGRNAMCVIKGNPLQDYYFQSKNPAYFEQFVTEFPPNVILVTTLECECAPEYGETLAPCQCVRASDFKALDYPRKVITIEPLMDFTLESFVEIITDIAPEYVWIGFNSRPKQVQLPEPSEEKVAELIRRLQAAGIEVRAKDLRGMEVGK